MEKEKTKVEKLTEHHDQGTKVRLEVDLYGTVGCSNAPEDQADQKRKEGRQAQSSTQCALVAS